MNVRKFCVMAGLVALCALPALATPLEAAPQGALITVTTIDDEFNTVGTGKGCALREAITAANSDLAFGGCPKGNGDDTIQLEIANYAITRANDDNANQVGDFDVTENVTLLGKSEQYTVVNGSYVDRVFDLHNGANVTLEALTIQNGSSAEEGGGIRADAGVVRLTHVLLFNNYAQNAGGGMHNHSAELWLDGVTFKENRVNTGFASGGGLWNEGGALIANTTFSKNEAFQGAGLWNNATVLITNSTFSGNVANGDGGGISNSGVMDMSNGTVTLNTTDNGGTDSGNGGGIFNFPTHTFLMRNSIVAGNFDKTASGYSATHYVADCGGSYNDGGYNLIGTGNGCGGLSNGTNGNQVGSDGALKNPLLYALAGNGGYSPTHALFGNSPAVDAGAVNGCKDKFNQLLATDQRGYMRSVDGNNDQAPRCDIGAMEFKSDVLPPDCGAVKPGAPTLLTPEDDKKIKKQVVVLDWEDVTCGNKYKVEVRRDTNKGIKDSGGKVNVSTFTTAALLKGHKYFWRVKACDDAGCAKSGWSYFTIKQ